MAKYLISFPSGAMQVTPEELEQASIDSHEVVRAAKAAGVWVFGGGIDEDVPPVRVHADGSITEDTYEQTRRLEGGYTVIDVPTRAEAEDWARKIAVACRCPQELRLFMHDPES